MIPDVLIGFTLLGFNIIVDILPALPATPEVVLNATDVIFTYLSQAVSFLSYLYTPVFLIAIFGLTVFYFGFEFIVRLITWILRIFSEIASAK